MKNLSDQGVLLRVPRDEYGGVYREHFLEQYKLYVESADRVSQRRIAANNFLLTVNAFLVTLYGLASSFVTNWAWRFVVPAAGILVCSVWLELIRSYRNLNTAKFKVIHELEEHLPVALFDREWAYAQRGQGKAYKPLTRVELFIPLVFAALYTILAVCAPTAGSSIDAPSLPNSSKTSSALLSGPSSQAVSIDVRRPIQALSQYTPRALGDKRA